MSKGNAGARVATLVLTGLLLCACSEEVPSTDIFLLPLQTHDATLTVGEPRNITSREGYDNQPSFLPDSSALLYTAMGEDGQSDIWRYDLADGRAERITRTPEREYSPTVPPAGRGFSVVRVDADGTQRLWQFDGGASEPHLVAPKVRGVGYHLWIDPTTVGLYILAAAEGEPATLEIVDLGTGHRRVMARAIGRSLARVPGKATISFVDMTDEATWWVSELDPVSGDKRKLVPTLRGCEDYAWTSRGTLLMPCGSGLYQWTPPSTEWQLVAALAPHGLSDLTRVALSPDGRWIALVGVDP